MILTNIADNGLSQAVINALLGYGVVFFGLILLMLVVTLLGKFFVLTTKKPQKAEAPAPVVEAPAPAPEAPGTAGLM